MTQDEVLTVGEVALQLKCSITTVYALIEDGQLKAFRLKGKKGAYRIRCSAMENYIAESEEKEGRHWDEHNRQLEEGH